ncbi:MAG: hypothetical protein LBM41_00845 [Ruminococcus sp.]|jgi:hypothetical protein|nr:hypothetical protein [Ruminococcus sp.]
MAKGYTALVAAKLRAAEVLKDNVVFSNAYEGNAVSGAVRIPVRDTEAEVEDYSKNSGMSPNRTSTSYITMSVDKDKAVNEIIDGFEAAGVPDNILAERLDSAGYSLAHTVDTDGAAVLLSEGTTDYVTLDEDTVVYDLLVDTRTTLSKINVPNDGRRYLLVTPDFYAKLLKDPNFIGASSLGDDIRQTGCIGKVAGFNVYEWNDPTENLLYVAGHPSYAVRARDFSVPIKVVSLDGDAIYIGASAVKGRLVYGHKVTKPAAVRCVYAEAV